MAKTTIFILGAGSDIGKELVLRYLNEGKANVVGTYRHLENVKDIINKKGINLLKCDLLNNNDINNVVKKCARIRLRWDSFISCVGSLEPIGKFFDTDFDKWENSIVANSIGQLRFLHSIYSYRRKSGISDIVFFAGGGTNNPLNNYSAYCVSKILLIKICELLDDENKDINTFIIGPGWVKTKMLNQTLKNRKAAGKIYKKTVNFLNSCNEGTSYQDIYDCINWCCAQGRKVVGGRNISVVYDGWRNGGKNLKRNLLLDKNKFKLRRFKNTEKKGII